MTWATVPSQGSGHQAEQDMGLTSSTGSARPGLGRGNWLPATVINSEQYLLSISHPLLFICFNSLLFYILFFVFIILMSFIMNECKVGSVSYF